MHCSQYASPLRLTRNDSTRSSTVMTVCPLFESGQSLDRKMTKSRTIAHVLNTTMTNDTLVRWTPCLGRFAAMALDQVSRPSRSSRPNGPACPIPQHKHRHSGRRDAYRNHAPSLSRRVVVGSLQDHDDSERERENCKAALRIPHDQKRSAPEGAGMKQVAGQVGAMRPAWINAQAQ